METPLSAAAQLAAARMVCVCGGASACKNTPCPPQHPWRERVLLGPGLLAGPTQRAQVAGLSPSPCARTVAQAGTPSPAAAPCLHRRALGAGVLVPLPSSTPGCLAGREPLERLPAAACTDLGWAGAGGGSTEEEEDMGTGTRGSGPAHGCHCGCRAAPWTPHPGDTQLPPQPPPGRVRT